MPEEQKKKAASALKQVGSVVNLDKKIKDLKGLAGSLGNNVDDFVDQYTTICTVAEATSYIPFIKLPNVTEIILDKIYDKSDMAEPVLEKVFEVLGTSIDQCEDNDCLNPCTDEVGACLKCFSGALNERKRLDICDACVV